jgi:mannosyltransferase OCH1-like enzyme
VWLGGGKYSPSVERCINSWKCIMPDYEIKCWNEKTFDINSVDWVKEAIEQKKWSLASDFIRHYAVYTEGGIYMDTDVFVYKTFDEFLQYDFFSSVEIHPHDFNLIGKYQIDHEGNPLKFNSCVSGIGLLAATYGACAGNPFIKECLDFFGNRHFIDENGKLFEDIINPGIMAMILSKYGFLYRDEKQILYNNMVVFPSNVFAGDLATKTKQSYSMHWCDSSWRKNKLNKINRVKLLLETNFPKIFRK